MTTQLLDLKKLREVTSGLPDEASVNVHIAKLDELIGPLGYCSFEQAHAWAVLKFQISQLLAANPSALLDAYEASARDAELWRGLEKAIAEDLAEPPCPSWLRHATQGD